jgi:hypothetical protein
MVDNDFCAGMRLFNLAYVEGDDMALVAARDFCLESNAEAFARQSLKFWFDHTRADVAAMAPADREEWLRVARGSVRIGYEEWCRQQKEAS